MKYLQKIKTAKKLYGPYCELVDATMCDEILYLAKILRSRRIVHINSTPKGGGVAEILSSLVPLTESFGIKTDWYSFRAKPAFFQVTRKMHDLLQGRRGSLGQSEKKLYLSTNRALAKEIARIPGDILFIHDPQPLALAHFLPVKKTNRILISVLHIDLSSPNVNTLNFIKPYLENYKRFIVSLPEYLRDINLLEKKFIVPPAIDPLSVKNRPMAKKQAAKIVQDLGVNPEKPILLHILRFDPWKDPFGTVELHRLLKKRHPNLQTVLLGFQLAQDDATAKSVYTEVGKVANGLNDIHLFFHLKQSQKYSIDEIVSAFLETATTVVHKSIREGFGLVVSEAMWKETPVVGGCVGGIRLQIEDGINGYLVSHVMEAEKIIDSLLKRPALRRQIGQAGHERIRQHFLLPRMLRDHLKIASDLVRTDKLFV